MPPFVLTSSKLEPLILMPSSKRNRLAVFWAWKYFNGVWDGCGWCFLDGEVACPRYLFGSNLELVKTKGGIPLPPLISLLIFYVF
jgi:hypothetical protein